MLDLTKKKEQLDLRKQVVLDLKKKINLEGINANVVVCMDYSGSMSHEYERGYVQDAVERVLPLALAFDPDGKAPLYLFHNDVKHCGEMDKDNVFDAIDNAQRKMGSMGGTEFATAIKKIVSDTCTGESKGLISKLFGKKEAKQQDIPTLVLFFTDGDTSNRHEVETEMIKASKQPVFFQFIGIGGVDSHFLENLDNMSGRFIDNANYFKMPSLNSLSDEELYSKILKEFPSYIEEARKKNLIK